ncbi:MAG: hypothetical protein ACQESR_14410 [Planctomycetota bacterium]
MSTFTQLGDLLEHVRNVHEQAAACCAQAKYSTDDRLNLLLDYFRHWEQRLERFLDTLERQERKAFLDTWVQFAPTEDVNHALSALTHAQDEPPETLVNRCFDLREQILALIDLLADRLKAPDVRDQLSKLAEIERKAARDLGIADIMRHDA